jgi:hypothetical protein
MIMLNSTRKILEDEIKRILNSVCDDKLKVLTEYVIPVFQITAILLNIFNAITLSSWKKARCLSISAIVDSTQFFIHFLITQSFCLNDPNLVFKYSYQLYQLYVRSYLSRVVTMISSLINIQIAVDRYYIIKNGYNLKSIKGRLLLFVVFSLIFYSPNLLLIKIYELDNVSIDYNFSIYNEYYGDVLTKYYVSFFTEFAQSRQELKIGVLVLQYLGTMIYLAVMITFNVLIFKDFKKSQKIYKNLLARLNQKTTSDKDRSSKNCEIFINSNEMNNKKDSGDDNQLKETIIDQNGHTTLDNRNNGTSNNNKIDSQYKVRMKLLINWISCVFIIDQILTSFGSTTYFFFQSSSLIQGNVLTVTLFLRSVFSISNIVFYSIFYKSYRKTLITFSWLLVLFAIVFNGCFFLMLI